jgi:hypothetical protein
MHFIKSIMTKNEVNLTSLYKIIIILKIIPNESIDN